MYWKIMLFLLIIFFMAIKDFYKEVHSEAEHSLL